MLQQVARTRLSSIRPSLCLAQPLLLRPSLASPALASHQQQQRMFALTPHRKDQPKTFSRQKELPRLPVPTLDKSLERYIKSLRPLLLEKARQEGKGEESVEEGIRQREAWAKDFEEGLGRLLQERLKDVDRSSPSNWLDDNFWLKCAYHSWRVPLPVNSNWWILMADDVGIPESVRSSVPPKGEYTEWQVKRSAKLVERLVEFKLKLDRQDILPDSSRAGPFDMHQYTRVYGVTRVPGLPTDSLVHSPHPHPSSFIIVSVNDHFYKLPVTTKEGDAIPLATLEANIWAIADDAGSRAPGAGVGACSGDSRDAWTDAREHLLALDPQNRANITTIEDSLFVLSLDAHTIKSAEYKSSSPKTQTPDLDAHIVSASSSAGTGRNRWWDKGIAVAVETNGRASMIGEHSPCDALIPSIVADYVLAEGVAAEGQSMRGKGETALERLEWKLDAKAEENIEKAVATVAAIAKDSDGKMLWFDEYGVEWIKKIGKQSPDAYLQMALQLAYHKTHNIPVATYETASTRLFLHGRTEVIRTLSEDSWRWVRAMRDGEKDHTKLYDLLTIATKAHNTYTRDASTGRGSDRHFMGLKLMMREGESHALFEDPLFQQSQDWILSTSGLSAGDRFYGTGFGTIWPNGYGINYLAGNQIIKFGIESKHSCAETSTEVFRNNLVEALREMKAVCEQGQVPEQQAAKL
ncbi:acyltransferase ChoActase/COT/CPT [Leucosporidium creatinivorum]|uniref:Acyltransferase ChoActase/COT/CPT n=1 Tax=Leucosporidium creatinivorum TaxID=106004 RepID=A0A1Y2FXJ3_9BASI|nr:acyltransferase ChoActase/COT/CPT [Leucosporidium creatinivorum]